MLCTRLLPSAALATLFAFGSTATAQWSLTENSYFPDFPTSVSPGCSSGFADANSTGVTAGGSGYAFDEANPCSVTLSTSARGKRRLNWSYVDDTGCAPTGWASAKIKAEASSNHNLSSWISASAAVGFAVVATNICPQADAHVEDAVESAANLLPAMVLEIPGTADVDVEAHYAPTGVANFMDGDPAHEEGNATCTNFVKLEYTSHARIYLFADGTPGAPTRADAWMSASGWATLELGVCAEDVKPCWKPVDPETSDTDDHEDDGHGNGDGHGGNGH